MYGVCIKLKRLQIVDNVNIESFQYIQIYFIDYHLEYLQPKIIVLHETIFTYILLIGIRNIIP